MRHPYVVPEPKDPYDDRIQGPKWNADHILPALSADLDDPAEDTSVMWMSDGTESGNNGDIMMKQNIAGVVTTSKLHPKGIAWIEKSADYDVLAGQGILADTTGGEFAITLPPSPTEGDEVGFQDANANFSTNNLSIRRNGSLIHGIAENLTCNVDHVSYKLIYSGATQGWKLDTYYAGAITTPSSFAITDMDGTPITDMDGTVIEWE